VYHDLISQAATLGTKASTTPVRKAVDGEGDGAPVIHDLGAFKDACEDAGFSFG